MRDPAGLRLAGSLLAIAAALTLAVSPGGRSVWVVLPVLGLGFSLALHASGSDRLPVAYLSLVFFAFIAAPLLRGSPIGVLSRSWHLVAIWVMAWAAGAYLAGHRVRNQVRMRRSRAAPDSASALPAALLVGVGSLVAQALLTSRDATGYSAQVRGVATTGWAGLLASIGPVAAGTAYWLARRPDRPALGWRLWTLTLVGLQGLALASTGFRGSGPAFILTIWLVGRHWNPGLRLRPRNVVLAFAALAVLAGLFTVGSVRRSDVAQSVGRSSEGTQVGRISDVPGIVVKRFDYSPYLVVAVDRASDPDAQKAVSIGSELTAFVPRFLWPGKPTIDYGRRISYVFFDVPTSYPTASTITWLGDLYVQGGSLGILVTGVLLGYGVIRFISNAHPIDGTHLAAYFVVVQTLLGIETPLLIGGATALRVLLGFAFLWFTVRKGLELARPGRVHVQHRGAEPAPWAT